MKSFLGQHTNRLDQKKRVSVPAVFRTALVELSGRAELILKPSIAHACIEAWPMAKYNVLEEALNKLDPFSEAYEIHSTALNADASLMEADKDGRILLPDSLIAYAGLGDEVMFIGIGASFQIWEPAAGARRVVEVREQARAMQKAAA